MLSELRLRDFRCFERLDLELREGANYFIGPNARGKTTILEAACVLLRLQSPRTQTLSQAARLGGAGFGIDGCFDGTRLQVRVDGGGRMMRLDSVVQSGADAYLGIGRVVWFGGDDLELVRGGGARRRRYLDFLGAQTVRGYLTRLRGYERALRSRNLLLREGRPRIEVDAYTVPLIETGEFIIRERARLVEELQPLLAEACHAINGGTEDLQASHQPGADPGGLENALAASRQREERLRQTVVGPHRDDLVLQLDGLTAAAYGSEGQQRTIALAMKLAQARLITAREGRMPVLLMDDVFGELDPQRRNRLLAGLPQGAQQLITTTTLDWLDAADPARVQRLDAHAVGIQPSPERKA